MFENAVPALNITGVKRCCETIRRSSHPARTSSNNSKEKRNTKSLAKKKGDPSTTLDMTKEPYILSHGWLCYDSCKTVVSWPNRSKHVLWSVHLKNRQAAKNIKADMKEVRPMVLQRINQEGLVGKTYTDDHIDNTMMWTRIACRGNWSTHSVQKSAVSLVIVLCCKWSSESITSPCFLLVQPLLRSVTQAPIPNRNEMNDQMTDLRCLH